VVPRYVSGYNKHKKSELILQGTVWDVKYLKRMFAMENNCPKLPVHDMGGYT